MSITRIKSLKLEKESEEAEKAMEEFLKKGGKIKKIPDGVHTEAKDMKYKYRRGAKKKEE